MGPAAYHLAHDAQDLAACPPGVVEVGQAVGQAGAEVQKDQWGPWPVW